MTHTPEPVACPFCGAHNRSDFLSVYPSSPSLGRSNWSVHCDDCGAEGPTVSQYNSDDPEALCIAAWNRRAPTAGIPTDALEAGAVRELVEALERIARHAPLFDYVRSQDGKNEPGSPYDEGRSAEAKFLSSIARAALAKAQL